MKFDSLKRKIELKVRDYFHDEGYSDDELDTLNLYRIEVKNNIDGKFTDIYVYAEIPVENFFEVDDIWNEVLIDYDESAYFDAESPGVYMARIYWNAMKNSVEKQSAITRNNLIKLGETICLDLEDENDEVFYVDDIYYEKVKDILTIEVSSTTFESKASMKLYEDDISSYRDLVDFCKDKLLRRLRVGMMEI